MEKKYDLEDRTLNFAKSIIKFINKIRKTLANVEIAKQLIRSGGSVGANYIEANEALSKKDFIYRVKLCRKEAKEITYWIKLIECNSDLDTMRNKLIQESIELTNIFGAIFRKSTQK